METKNRTIDSTEDVKIITRGAYRSLHALKNFSQGQRIIGLPTAIQIDPDKYSIEVWPGVHIDCKFSPAGAINHSCEPNAAVKDWRIVAWSCIQAGDQVTIDYKRTESKLAVPFDCSCGSKNCRGKIE